MISVYRFCFVLFFTLRPDFRLALRCQARCVVFQCQKHLKIHDEHRNPRISCGSMWLEQLRLVGWNKFLVHCRCLFLNVSNVDCVTFSPVVTCSTNVNISTCNVFSCVTWMWLNTYLFDKYYFMRYQNISPLNVNEAEYGNNNTKWKNQHSATTKLFIVLYVSLPFITLVVFEFICVFLQLLFCCNHTILIYFVLSTSNSIYKIESILVVFFPWNRAKKFPEFYFEWAAIAHGSIDRFNGPNFNNSWTLFHFQLIAVQPATRESTSGTNIIIIEAISSQSNLPMWWHIADRWKVGTSDYPLNIEYYFNSVRQLTKTYGQKSELYTIYVQWMRRSPSVVHGPTGIIFIIHRNDSLISYNS